MQHPIMIYKRTYNLFQILNNIITRPPLRLKVYLFLYCVNLLVMMIDGYTYVAYNYFYHMTRNYRNSW